MQELKFVAHEQNRLKTELGFGSWGGILILVSQITIAHSSSDEVTPLTQRATVSLLVTASPACALYRFAELVKSVPSVSPVFDELRSLRGICQMP